jgi:CRP-like cAMP-binding protein
LSLGIFRRLVTVPCELMTNSPEQGAAVGDSSKRAATKSDPGPSQVDGQEIKNNLLLNLPSREYDSILEKLTFVPMRRNDVLHEPGQPIKFAYFINSGLASILNAVSDGKSVEVGLTGKEGFIGLPLIVGFSTSPSRAVTQVEGSAFRINAKELVDVLRRCPTLEKRLQRCVQVLAMQSAQVALCNRLHEVDERLARWLLMSHDRLDSDRVPLTQDFLAHMLGTRRSSVTVAAGILQKAGLITYRRGDVRVVDRSKLEEACCECYQAMRQQIQNWETESH